MQYCWSNIIYRAPPRARGLKLTFNTGQRRKELDQRLEKAGLQFEWEDIKHDLNALQEVTLEESGRKHAIRTASVGTCGKVFQTIRVAMPPSIRNV